MYTNLKLFALFAALFVSGCASVPTAAPPPAPEGPSAPMTTRAVKALEWSKEVAEVKSIQRVLVNKEAWERSKVCRLAKVAGRVGVNCVRQVVLVRPYMDSFGQTERRVFLITYRYINEIHTGVIETYLDSYIDVFVDVTTGQVKGPVNGQ